MRLNDLAAAVEITPQNLSILKTGKAKAIRFSTLEAICKTLACQPGEILEFRSGRTDKAGTNVKTELVA
jgi:putative transcriptional regulator